MPAEPGQEGAVINEAEDQEDPDPLKLLSGAILTDSWQEAFYEKSHSSGCRRSRRPTLKVCNRYRMTASRAALAERYGVKVPADEHANLPPPELFPKKPGWVVRAVDGETVLDVMSWGFPHSVRGQAASS